MADISEFEPLLKEVVQAKRLSASKMQKLTELAMKCMEHDTQMVSMLYRTHKSLEGSFKISSLYVFDALARAAKSKVVKQGLSADGSTGNVATFLSKLGGVVEGLFRDMVSSGVPEGKAKTKKVLDIWVKGGTFPANQLADLGRIVEGEKQEPVPNVIQPPTPELTTPPPAPTPTEVNPQAALLALLAQAANTSNSQTNVNIPAAPFGVTQLAALQQLPANVAPAVPNVSLHTLTSTAAPHPPPHPQGNSFTAGPNRSSRSPIPDDPRRPADSRRERRFSSEVGRSPEYRSDPRMHRDPRSNTRGRGSWGDRDRRRWDDRDGYDNRDRDRDYLGRSRSRSPPSRFAERRHERAFSPRRSRSPRRRNNGPAQPPPPSSSVSSWSNNPSLRNGSAPCVTKDEFGRDVRPSSPPANGKAPPPPPSVAPSHSAPATTSAVAPPTKPMPSMADTHNTNGVDGTKFVAPLGPITPSPDSAQPSVPPQVGMESFDISTFDLTSAASWEALGKMWHVTYGCPPRGDQLMQFVMSMSMGGMGMPAGGDITGTEQGHWGGGHEKGNQPQQNWGLHGRGHEQAPRSRGRGRGGFHGNSRDGHRGYNNYSSNNDTDAIVLGGGDDNEVYEHKPVPETYSVPTLAESNSGGGLGGKMQKVGDKWVFVKNA